MDDVYLAVRKVTTVGEYSLSKNDLYYWFRFISYGKKYGEEFIEAQADKLCKSHQNAESLLEAAIAVEAFTEKRLLMNELRTESIFKTLKYIQNKYKEDQRI